MKILWLTPIGKRSAIGRFSQLVVAELFKSGENITVVSSETQTAEENHEFLANTYTSIEIFLAQEDIESFDVIIANFGDHFHNHANCLRFLGQSRLIGIFHDADMTNLGNGFFAFSTNMLPQVPPTILERGQITGSIAAQCSGVVVHAPFYVESVDSCDGPVAVIPLAWGIDRQLGETNHPQLLTDRIGLLTIGNVNRNKCADRVIKALGTSDYLRTCCNYRLVGAIEDKERRYLTALAEEQGVSLVIVGPVDEEVLHKEIAQADIVSCLREPVLEGASASAIECMMYGKAVMVSHAGFYLELPADGVVQVAAQTHPEDIRRSLETVAINAELRQTIGRKAKAFADRVFSPRSYAEDLLALIKEVRAVCAYRPTQQRIAVQLQQLGIGADTSSAAFIEKALESMVPVKKRQPIAAICEK